MDSSIYSPGDTFKVVYVADTGKELYFHTIDAERSPSGGDFVVVDRINEPGLAIQRFHGQTIYYGVANFLNYWQFEHSEQRPVEEQRPKEERPAPKAKPKR